MRARRLQVRKPKRKPPTPFELVTTSRPVPRPKLLLVNLPPSRLVSWKPYRRAIRWSKTMPIREHKRIW